MLSMVSYFLSTDAAATAIYSLFLHDALPISLGGGSQGGLYEAYVARDTIDPSIGRRPELVGAGQWDLLARIVRERDPKTIAVDISHTHAFSDGLSAGEWEQLSAALPSGYLARVVRAE